ncbi:MAG: DNA polymerase/3'-5' exonuclease PolX [Candidatus Omnitrophota bacterium]
MSNREIAAVFSRIADALEIKGENVFRVRAYRTAAQNITGLSRELEDIRGENPDLLDNIPGIGKDLKAKILEMIETGRLSYYDDLTGEFPKGFMELLNIAGLGPRKLKKLYDELGIRDIDDLEDACNKKKLGSIEGMGEKTQEKFLEAIEHYRKRQGRMLLPEAYAYAEKITEYLSRSGIFTRIEKAGSLRRGSETVGDIDILAIARDNTEAMDHFTSYPAVESVIAKGPTKSSVTLKDGPQVDLRVIDSSCFGAALVYFTGSKEHNIKIRQLAKNRGWKVNEYGLFSVDEPAKKEKFIAGKTEEEVYAELGMEWIPPELRESRGELEAAVNGTLPGKLIDIRDIRGDLHLHTTETDGRASIGELAEAAREKGYKYIAITDHSKYVRIANGMDEKRFSAHLAKIRKANRGVKDLEILAGVEVDILEDGSLDFSDTVLKEADIVIAAIHSHFGLDKEKQTGRILRALDNKYVNILAHPSGRLITSRASMRIDFDRVFAKAAENKVFMEINTHGERIDLSDVNCMRAKEFGVKFAIDTDAHEARQMDLVRFGVITARRAWLKKKDVLNTCSFAALMKALKK